MVASCRQDLTAAKAAFEELFGKIREIRRKAEASEIMVQEICRDIRKLDFAKTHLTHTITALRRLAMLVNAVGALLPPCLMRTRMRSPWARRLRVWLLRSPCTYTSFAAAAAESCSARCGHLK